MTPELITRVVGLVKTQGDRVVLADSATGKAVVIISLDEYERMSLGQVQEPQHAEPAPRPAFSYTPAAPVVAAEAPAPKPTPVKPVIGPRVEAAVHAPEITPKTPAPEPQKTAIPSDNPFKKKAAQLGVPVRQEHNTAPDLTQAQLLDKINREIGDWKTAQERKRAEELTSAAHSAPRIEPDSLVEEEERFYLEPIE
jgi:hypothetical protein